MSWTLMVLLACLAGHPDRCGLYRLDTDAPVEACQEAARQWLDRRPYLIGTLLTCTEEMAA